MENNSKVHTYIGFSIRNGKSKIGTGAVQTLKSAGLVIVCKSASENTVKEAKKLARRFRCPIIKTTEKLLEDYTFKPNSKVMAICDKELVKAILSSLENEFVEVGD